MDVLPIFTVSELNNYVKEFLDSDPKLKRVYVQGEITNYKKYPSGHHYFSIKDSSSTLKCVMFSYNAKGLRFQLENGMKVIILGSVSLYIRDGAFQMYCSQIIPDGIGQLQIAYEQLKKKLNDEGLFETAHKKRLPEFPQRIGIVTSGSGAAVRDIIKILRSRWPLSKVLVIPVKVQGDGAASEITQAIDYLNQTDQCDVIITGRGGGSLEDLWAFNEEIVARAIFKSHIPVISAVGHEPDVTISDFVSDLRASTPSNGAELAVHSVADIREHLVGLSIRMNYRIDSIFDSYNRNLESISLKYDDLSPDRFFQRSRQDLDYFSDKINRLMLSQLDKTKRILAVREASLAVLNPLETLNRGYSVASKSGYIVSSKSDLLSGEDFSLTFYDGVVDCIVK